MKSALLFLSLFLLLHSSASAKPNILFIAVDDMRPELGCYGNKIVKTPNIDLIAVRGIVFNKAYCQQAVCSPSRTAIMTGLRPEVTKMWDLKAHFRVAQPDCITLPQHFKANGYHCAAQRKVYHSGFEDGCSWNEPHWYPKGRAVDTDPVDWTKQIVTRHEVNTEEYSAPQEGGPTRNNGNGQSPTKPATASTLAKPSSCSTSISPGNPMATKPRISSPSSTKTRMAFFLAKSSSRAGSEIGLVSL